MEPAGIVPGASRAEAAAHLAALRRLRTRTRERFGLDAAATVLVEQAACTEPGFPPLATRVTFWSAPGTRHEFRIFKPVAAIDDSDLPPAWMKAALTVAPVDGCPCC